MKKKLMGLLAAVLAVGVLSGCGEDPVMTNSHLREMKVEQYVTLGDYKNISVEVAPVEVEQENWDQLLLAVYQSGVTAEIGAVTDRAVVNGDTVIIDYVGKLDGVAFDGGTASGADLVIGSGSFIDGFEEGLIGVKPGETVDLNLTFPESYHNADMAGKSVVFTVTVNYILPGLNDTLKDEVVAALQYPDVNTVEDLRQYVYDYLQESAQDTYLYNVQDAIMAVLMERTTIAELPETFVDSYEHVYLTNLEQMGAYYGVDAETYCTYFYGMDSASYADLYSEMQARQEVLMQAIANVEGLNVSDEELQTALDEYLAASGYETLAELLGGYTEEEYRNYLMCDKVMAYLVENSTVTAPAEGTGTGSAE